MRRESAPQQPSEPSHFQMGPSEPFLTQNQMAGPSHRQCSDRPLRIPYHTYQQPRNIEKQNRMQRQAIRPVHPQIQWIRHDIGANIAVDSTKRRRKIKKRASTDRRWGSTVASDVHCSQARFPSSATHLPFRRDPGHTPRQKIRPRATGPEKSNATSDELAFDPSPDESEVEEMKKIMELMKEDEMDWTKWSLNDHQPSAEVPLYDSKV